MGKIFKEQKMKRTFTVIAFLIMLLPCCERNNEEPKFVPVQEKTLAERQLDSAKSRLESLIQKAESTATRVKTRTRTITTVRAYDPVPH